MSLTSVRWGANIIELLRARDSNTKVCSPISKTISKDAKGDTRHQLDQSIETDPFDYPKWKCGADIFDSLTRRERRIPLSRLIKGLGGAEHVVFMGFLKSCGEDEAAVFMFHSTILLHAFYPFAPLHRLIGRRLRRIKIVHHISDLLLDNVILLFHPCGISVVVRRASSDVRMYYHDEYIFGSALKTLDEGHALFSISTPSSYIPINHRRASNSLAYSTHTRCNGSSILPLFIYVAPSERSVLRFLLPAHIALRSRVESTQRHSAGISDGVSVTDGDGCANGDTDSDENEGSQHIFTSLSCLKSWFHSTTAHGRKLCCCCPVNRTAAANSNTSEADRSSNQPKVAVVSFQGHRFCSSLLSRYFPNISFLPFDSSVRVITCDPISCYACVAIGISATVNGGLRGGYSRYELAAMLRLDLLEGTAVVMDLLDMHGGRTPEARMLWNSCATRVRERNNSKTDANVPTSRDFELPQSLCAQANVNTIASLIENATYPSGECPHSEDTTVLRSFSTHSRHTSDVWMEDMCHPRFPVVVFNDMMYADSGLDNNFDEY